MRTLWLEPSTDPAEVAREIIRNALDGGIVLVPTETQYGLFCDAENAESMRSLGRLKGRSLAQPSAVFVNDWQHARKLVKTAPRAIEKFVSRFWPGALTIVAESSRSNWPGVVSSKGTVGLRCSSHPILRRIAALSKAFFTATSANIHGEPPQADPEHLINWLAGDVELFIFDACARGDVQASTVIEIGPHKPIMVRKGGIAESLIQEAWEQEMRRG